MSNKNSLLIILVLILILPNVACQSTEHSIGDSSDQMQNDIHWRWKSLGFEKKSVDQIQVTDNGEIFAISEGKIYCMKDGEWRPMGPHKDISAFCIAQRNDEIAIIAGGVNGKLYIHLTGDDNWTELSIQALPEPINIIIPSPSTDDIYVGQSSKKGGGLWKILNLGADWIKLTDITTRGIAVHPKDPEIIYIVDKLTYLSVDGGESWLKVDTGANYGALIHPLYPETAYLAYSQGVVSVNHDGEILSQQQFYLPGAMTRLELSPSNLNEWALGVWDYPSGVGGLYYTFNGGAHWINLEEEMNNIRILDLCYSKDGRTLYIGTAEGGLWALNVEDLKKNNGPSH